MKEMEQQVFWMLTTMFSTIMMRRMNRDSSVASKAAYQERAKAKVKTADPKPAAEAVVEESISNFVGRRKVITRRTTANIGVVVASDPA